MAEKQALHVAFGMACGLMMLLQLLEVESSIHHYSKGEFSDNGNAYLFYAGSEGMHAHLPKESPAGIADGRSYIRFDSIKFRRTPESAALPSTGLIQAIIFEASDRDKIGGSAYGGRLAICCTPDLAKLQNCKQDEVIIRPSSDDANWPFTIPVSFGGGSVEATMRPNSVNITRTGMYNLYFIVCDPHLKGLVVDGMTIWKNPSGYLPGRMAPLVTFYGALSLAYLVLGVAWIFQSIRFWKDILALQNYLTAIITLGMFEVTLWYFEYTNFNATGYRPMAITLWAVTFGAIKKTLSRLLILVVSMGYGVVRPTLGGLTMKVVLLGATYFLASETLDVYENVGAINDFSGHARLILVFPVALLDAFFVLWTLKSLSRTLEKLQARRMVAKLELYRKFTNGLAVLVVVAVAWIGYELYYKATDTFSERWQGAWIIASFWNILTFAMLCVICALWAPSQNSTRYAYSEEVGDNFDDDDNLPLKGYTAVQPEDPSPKLDSRADTFGAINEPEEDKRE